MPAVIENKIGQETNLGHFYLTEISNLVFPQHINPDGYNLSVIHISIEDDEKLDSPFVVTKRLCLRAEHLAINYIKSTLNFTLHFPPEDIIYPFYDFW